ncbi:MAG: helix-turn-helix domain-containing protein [Candidatus Hydrogenedentes bacterium]|nr:helix-turn-helix domain-containing protein [Candidatus Hydrogenedentota bacterium]
MCKSSALVECRAGYLFSFLAQCDDLRTATKAFEREHIRSVLKACEWNKEAAAQRLEVNPSTLYRKMADLGSQPVPRLPSHDGAGRMCLPFARKQALR